MTPSSETTWAGFVPQVIEGTMSSARSTTSSSKIGVLVGDETYASARRPLRSRRPSGTLGRVAQVVDRRVVDGDQSGARAGLDAHVADRHPTFHREVADRVAPILDHVAGAAAGAEARDDGQGDVLGRHARLDGALQRHGHRLGLLLGECLGREHVFDLTGADPEGQRAEGAVGRGVRVAADDRHARLGHAEFGSDHVDDALVLMARGKTVMPNSSQFSSSASSWRREIGSLTGVEMGSVGTLWSAVARVRSGRRTPRPLSRRLSKA